VSLTYRIIVFGYGLDLDELHRNPLFIEWCGTGMQRGARLERPMSPNGVYFRARIMKAVLPNGLEIGARCRWHGCLHSTRAGGQRSVHLAHRRVGSIELRLVGGGIAISAAQNRSKTDMTSRASPSSSD
jgi:hypothetical protein